MGLIKDFIARKRERESRFSNAQEDDRIFRTINERKQSHEERVIIKGLEEDKQKALKETLHWENKKRQCEDRLHSRNMMKFNQGMFQNDSMLKEKDKFLRGGMF
jgi:hypothetical protein